MPLCSAAMTGLGLMALLLIAQPTSKTVWLPGEVDPALSARLGGQLSDLQWRVARGPTDAGPNEAPEHAAAVVWFERLRPGLRVRLGLPDGRRWRRDINDLGPAATYEAAALVLRSALVALDEGAAPAWQPEPRAEPPARFGWSLAGRTDVTGVATTGGLHLEGFRRWRSLSIGLSAATRWPFQVQETGTTLAVGRHDAVLRGGWDGRVGVRWTIGARLGGGTALWHRRTERTDADLAAAGSRWLVSALATAAVRGALRIGDGWSLHIEAGVDALPGAPQWRLSSGERVAQPWSVQPWIALGLGADPIFALAR